MQQRLGASVVPLVPVVVSARAKLSLCDGYGTCVSAPCDLRAVVLSSSDERATLVLPCDPWYCRETALWSQERDCDHPACRDAPGWRPLRGKLVSALLNDIRVPDWFFE